MNITVFWSVTSFNTAKHTDTLMPLSCLTYYSILKMEAIRSSETSVAFHGITTRYNLQGRILQKTIYYNILDILD